jgi:hypothetical protein
MKVPDAPKKNIADRNGLATLESYSIDEFLFEASKIKPAEAVIETGGDDLEDTASSALPLPKKNIFLRAYNACKNWANKHNRILIHPSALTSPVAVAVSSPANPSSKNNNCFCAVKNWTIEHQTLYMRSLESVPPLTF